MINSEYYPVIEQTSKKNINEKSTLVGLRSHQKIQSFDSAPTLQMQDTWEKR